MPVKKIEVNDDNHGRRLDNFLYLYIKMYRNQKFIALSEKEK